MSIAKEEMRCWRACMWPLCQTLLYLRISDRQSLEGLAVAVCLWSSVLFAISKFAETDSELAHSTIQSLRSQLEQLENAELPVPSRTGRDGLNQEAPSNAAQDTQCRDTW